MALYEIIVDYSTAIFKILLIQPKKVTGNLGQWLILHFKAYENFIEAAFCIDFEKYNQTETLEISHMEVFHQRWAKDKDIRLVYFSWDAETELPVKFLEAWHSAILHAYNEFRKWRSTTFMRFNQPELATVFLGIDENNGIRRL
jgi:hypothetical protein